MQTFKRSSFFASFAATLWLCGCATFSGPDSQGISVHALDERGALVIGAQCRLSNDKGQWAAKSPGFAMVRRSVEDLQVTCSAPGYESGTAVVVSNFNGGMVGNAVIAGGIVGAVVDRHTGAGFDYPELIKVALGAHTLVDPREKSEDTATAAAPVTIRPSEGQARYDDLKKLLPPGN